MNKLGLVIFVALVAWPLWAQDISVYPASPAPDEPFFVRVAGTFPTPCSLNGDAFETLQGGGSIVLTLVLEPEACITVVTDLERSFGAFHLNSSVVSPGETVELVFRTDDGTSVTEIGRLDITVGAVGEKAVLSPKSGMYWDPFFAHNGVALEVHGNRLFVAAYSYDEDGLASWRVAQGEMNNGHFEADFLGFSDGPCLLCRSVDSEGQATGEKDPMQLVFAGDQAAFLGIGEEPGRALELRPFSQHLVESEGTIAGETFFMTDLGGQWLFTDTDDGAVHRVTDLALAPSGLADGGMAFFASADRSVTMECDRTAGPERFVCRLVIDEQFIGVAPSGDVGHNFVRGDEFLGIRLE